MTHIFYVLATATGHYATEEGLSSTFINAKQFHTRRAAKSWLRIIPPYSSQLIVRKVEARVT